MLFYHGGQPSRTFLNPGNQMSSSKKFDHGKQQTQELILCALEFVPSIEAMMIGNCGLEGRDKIDKEERACWSTLFLLGVKSHRER